MSLIMVGTLIDVTERSVTPDPAKGHTWAAFKEITLHVLDGRNVHKIGVGKDFRGDVSAMAKDQQLVLQVSVRPYPTNQGSAAGYALTAWEDVSARVEFKQSVKA